MGIVVFTAIHNAKLREKYLGFTERALILFIKVHWFVEASVSGVFFIYVFGHFHL